MNIGIIGIGFVGENLAIELLRRCPNAQLFLHNSPPEAGTFSKTLRVATELREIASFDREFRGYAAFPVEDVAALKTCDIIVICIKKSSNFAQVVDATKLTTGDPREALIGNDAAGIKHLAMQLRNSSSAFIIVTNPVEFMVQLFCSWNGCPREKIIGFGLSLDALRAQVRLDQMYPHARVQLCALGAHGSQAFISQTLSIAHNQSLSQFSTILRDAKNALKQGDEDATSRARSYNATVYGPAYVLANDIVRALNREPINASGFHTGLGNEFWHIPIGGQFTFDRGHWQPQVIRYCSEDESGQIKVAKRLQSLFNGKAQKAHFKVSV
jgi:malate/lactate dehydrogenase